MNKISNFSKELLARLKGDESAKIAAQNERKANVAVNSQLAALKAKQVDDENSLEDAKEAYSNAKYPTSRILDNKSYIDNVVRAKGRVDTAEAILKLTKDSITFFEEFLKEEWKQVDAE